MVKATRPALCERSAQEPQVESVSCSIRPTCHKSDKAAMPFAARCPLKTGGIKAESDGR